MKQHNLEKLQNILKVIIQFAMWLLGVLILLLLFQSYVEIKFSTISGIIKIMSFLLVLLINQFDKKLWKWDFINKHLPDKYWTPIIEGRWEGELNRNGEIRDFVIEIKQTYTSLSCITYSPTSSSSSIIAEILYNEQLKIYQLVFYWNGQTKNTQEGTGDTNRFDGFTTLDIIIKDKKATHLRGAYFTDRQPYQTKGDLILSFRQKELKNGF